MDRDRRTFGGRKRVKHNHIINDYRIKCVHCRLYIGIDHCCLHLCVLLSITRYVHLICSDIGKKRVTLKVLSARWMEREKAKPTAHVIDMCLTSFIMLFWCRCAFYRLFFLFRFLFISFHFTSLHCLPVWVCVACSFTPFMRIDTHFVCVINRMQYAIIWNAVIIWRKAI